MSLISAGNSVMFLSFIRHVACYHSFILKETPYELVLYVEIMMPKTHVKQLFNRDVVSLVVWILAPFTKISILSSILFSRLLVLF
jgi:hypothetical protein